MKTLILCAWATLCVAVSGAALAEARCDFNIIGTWETMQSSASEVTSTARYRFNTNGTVTSLRGASGSDSFLYRLDDARTPTLIELVGSDSKTTRGTLTITQFDRDTFTTSEGTLDTESPPTRWVHVEPRKYFIVFAARGSKDVHAGGPAFAMLIKTEAGVLQSEAFGLYLAENEPVVGQIPQQLRRQFMTESKLAAGTMLRVELSAAEYERSMSVMRSWRKRADDQALLYDTAQLNNIVFLKQIAESVNRCGDVMQLYPLTWKIDDKIVARSDLSSLALRYIQELKQRNTTQHISDPNFLKRTGIRCGGACT